MHVFYHSSLRYIALTPADYFNNKGKMIVTNDKRSHIDNKQWQLLINTSTTSSVFQSPEYFNFLESVSFLEPFVFSVSNNQELKGIVLGYIQHDPNKIKHYFTKRAIINGGPLLADNITPEELSLLLKKCTQSLKRKAIYIESRNFHDYSNYKLIFAANGFNYSQHLNFQIDTTSEAVVEKKISKSRKRDIKTSFREGATINESISLENVKEFYSILCELYKTRVKTPLFPFEFFEKLYASNLGTYILVSINNKIIGGTLCIGSSESTLYEWFACGADGIYKHVYPSTVATYAGIRYAAKNKHPMFDMMGAGKPNEAYGVRDFKAKFGGTLVEYGRYIFVCYKPLYILGKIGVSILKKI